MTLTVHIPSPGLAEHAARTADPMDTLVKAWLAGQRSPRTFDSYSYAIAIRQWRDWCGLQDRPERASTHGITAYVMGAA